MERRVIGWVFLVMLVALVGTIVWFGAAACRPPAVLPSACHVGEMRCHENVAEICGTDTTWVPALDCRAIGGHDGRPWVCVPLASDAGPFDDDPFTCRSEENVS